MIPCPRCGAGLTGGSACTTCGLPLVGPDAVELWRVDQNLAAIDRRLAGLHTERQRLWADHAALVARLGGDAPIQLPSFVPGSDLPKPPQPAPQWTTTPRREWTPQRVQNVLLTIGAVLLVIASAIFTVVSWHRLGTGPQTAVLAGLTLGSAFLARVLARRGLTATAEAISGVCIGLAMFDGYAAHHLLLPHGADRPYWAVASLVVALFCVALGQVTRVRLPWIAAAGLGLVPLVVLATGAHQGADTRALLLGLDSLAAAVALAVLRQLAVSGRTAADTRTCWIVGGSTAWIGGFLVPVSHLLYGLGGASLITVLGGLTASGCAAAVTAWTFGDAPLWFGVPARAPLTGATALSVICALTLPVQAHVDVVWWAATVISAAALVLVTGLALPAGWRIGPALTATVTAAIALSTEVPSVSTTIAGQTEWIGRPWSSLTAAAGRSAADAVATPQQWGGGGNLAALLVAAGTAALAGLLLNHRRPGYLTAAGLGSIAIVVAVPQRGGSFASGLAADGGLTVLAAMAAVLLQRRQLVAEARTAAAIAWLAGFLALSWSLALPSTAAIVATWLTAVAVAAAAGRVPYPVVWLGSGVLSAGYAAAAIAHEAGAPDSTLGLAVAAVAVVVTLLLLLLVAHQRSLVADVMDGCSLALTVVAIALPDPDSGWQSWTLLAIALWTVLSCLRTYRRALSPLASAVCLLSLTFLPTAQGLASGNVLAWWMVLVALALAGAFVACLPAENTTGHRLGVAVTLLLGSAVVGLAAIVRAVWDDDGLTAVLAGLCVLYAVVAAVPTGQLALRRISVAWRAGAATVAAGLLFLAVASGLSDADVGPTLAALVITGVAAALAIGAGLLPKRQPDASLVEAVCALTAALAAAGVSDPTYLGWILAVAGLTVLISAVAPRRRMVWPAGVLLLAWATWVWLHQAGVTAPEPYTDPIAVVALVAGYLRRRSQPTTSSFTAYGPGLVGLLLPTLGWALWEPGVDRPLLLAALATAVVIVGAQHGLRAPLLLGSLTLVTTALRLLAPYETMVPRWLEVGTAGALLLTLGATYEQRRRELGLLRARYDALL
jgi:hypothetical protein